MCLCVEWIKDVNKKKRDRERKIKGLGNQNEMKIIMQGYPTTMLFLTAKEKKETTYRFFKYLG